MNCSSVNKALISQMKKWASADNCKNGGEKCLYKVRDDILVKSSETFFILNQLKMARFPTLRSHIISFLEVFNSFKSNLADLPRPLMYLPTCLESPRKIVLGIMRTYIWFSNNCDVFKTIFHMNLLS